MSGLTKEQLDALGVKRPEIPADTVERQVTPSQRAYGLLWRTFTDLPFVHMARRQLFEALSKEERYAGIAWAIEKYGTMPTQQMIAADIQVGQFPEKSFG